MVSKDSPSDMIAKRIESLSPEERAALDEQVEKHLAELAVKDSIETVKNDVNNDPAVKAEEKNFAGKMKKVLDAMDALYEYTGAWETKHPDKKYDTKESLRNAVSQDPEYKDGYSRLKETLDDSTNDLVKTEAMVRAATIKAIENSPASKDLPSDLYNKLTNEISDNQFHKANETGLSLQEQEKGATKKGANSTELPPPPPKKGMSGP